MGKLELTLRVNGTDYPVVVDPGTTLLEVLRGQLDFTGVKQGCDGTGECGACTVLLDGKSVNSCLVLAMNAVGKEITTIEGLAKGTELNPLQKAFMDYGAVQCGFCTPGMILAAKGLLDEDPELTREDIKDGLRGNLCRCTGYVKIIDAVEHVAHEMSAGGKEK
ncbi:MAG: (2Fe-2S)-binding protein [Deltaproteobacteria bacterium]|nr:(2Fe-2S)-binding protein [Deltaproteobacteria bacterium]